MKLVSALYKKLLADPEHVRETMVKVGGVEYGPDKIFSCEVSDDLIPEAVIGSCVAHTLSLTVEADGTVPAMAQIETFSRLKRGNEASEWIPEGVFFIDTRDFDEGSGLLTIEGFDAMLKSEEVWWDPSEDAGEWPMPQTEAAADIAQRMGVELDLRNRIAAGLMVEYPNDLTMREVLGYIAISNAGNWVMSGDGKLLLTPLGGLPPETKFLVDDEDGRAILFGSVRIRV